MLEQVSVPDYAFPLTLKDEEEVERNCGVEDYCYDVENHYDLRMKPSFSIVGESRLQSMCSELFIQTCFGIFGSK